jgi:hypothetical protein
MRSRLAVPTLVASIVARRAHDLPWAIGRGRTRGGTGAAAPTSPPIAKVDNAYALANATTLPVEADRHRRHPQSR